MYDVFGPDIDLVVLSPVVSVGRQAELPNGHCVSALGPRNVSVTCSDRWTNQTRSWPN